MSTKSKKAKSNFTFSEAIKEVTNGKKIARLEWDTNVYGFLNRDILSLHKADGKNYQWVINDGDLLAKDWVVLEE